MPGVRYIDFVARFGFVFFLVLVSTAVAQQCPAISGQTLSGHPVTLPAATAGHPAILFVGFSHSSQKAVEGWSRQVAAQLKTTHPEVERFDIAVIQDAPRLVRGMITHGMKGSVPASEHDHFLTVTQGEDELKKAVDFSASDDAYVILLDPTGKITWHTHGDVSDAALKQLAEQVSAVTHK
jgi:hypothetical protein